MLDITETKLEVKSQKQYPRLALLRDVKSINKHSIKLNYNRTLNFKKFFNDLKIAFNKDENVVWRGMNTRVLLKPLYLSLHKSEKCKSFVRCEVFTDNMLKGLITLDIALDVYEELMTYEKINSLTKAGIPNHSYFLQHSEAIKKLVA